MDSHCSLYLIFLIYAMKMKKLFHFHRIFKNGGGGGGGGGGGSCEPPLDLPLI